MPIWVYRDDSQRRPSRAEFEASTCTFCRTALLRLGEKRVARGEWQHGGSATVTVFSCPTCGWWKVAGFFSGLDWNQDLVSESRCSHGSLLDLSTNVRGAPIDEVRRYLLQHYDKRNEVHPRLVEETVAAVFEDSGYEVELSAYSKDRGIDIILLQAPGGERTAVQVKRWKGKVGVEQVRQFAGALLSGGFTTGVFVTTSTYTKGAEEEVRSGRLMPITLMDAGMFYEALSLTTRAAYDSWDASEAPWTKLVSSFSLLHLVERWNSGFANE